MVGSVLMKVLLELMRLVFIFVFVGVILWTFINYIYSKLGVNIDNYVWMVHTAILISFFVLYRNKLQLSGWYTGKGKEKLPKIVSKLHISSSI